MSEFVPVAKKSELAAKGKLTLEVQGRFIVLADVGGSIYCIDDVCTHDGGTLGDGELVGSELACPRHGAKFDVRTGKALTMPATEPTIAHDVKIEGDQIFVSLKDQPRDNFDIPPPVAASSLCEDKVREALKNVIDPELFVNIVDLGLIYLVDLALGDDGKTNVKVEMTMTSPMCPAGPQLVGGSKRAIEELPGVGQVEIKVVMDPPWSPDKMTEEARDQLGIF
jgi:metal-sulfur cluster biosynthetic enzyme/nitrite reductase/ring-hydroxylating ferredoxin subunit